MPYVPGDMPGYKRECEYHHDSLADPRECYPTPDRDEHPSDTLFVRVDRFNT